MVFPLTLSVKEALQKINKILAEKNWKDFGVGELKLVLFPYYFYSYHSHMEQEENGKNIVNSSKDGFLVLNGFSLNIEENNVKMVKDNIEKLTSEVPLVEYEVKNSQINKSTQEHILKIKTAELLHLEKENVIVSNVKKIMVPMYELIITIDEKTYGITINAVNGEMYGIENILEREKGFLEITQETLRDLRDPKAWVEYTKGLAVETKKFVLDKNYSNNKKSSKKNNSKNDSTVFEMKFDVITNKWVIILIIILALFLIYLAFIA